MEEHEDLEKQVAHLKSGLENRGRIGIAIGIVMERYGLDSDLAFKLLVRISQHENRKMYVIAEEVIGGRDLSVGNDAELDA